MQINMKKIYSDAKKIDFQKPLVAFDELRSSVQKIDAIGPQISFLTKWRKLIMTISGLGALLSAAFYLLTTQTGQLAEIGKPTLHPIPLQSIVTEAKPIQKESLIAEAKTKQEKQEKQEDIKESPQKDDDVSFQLIEADGSKFKPVLKDPNHPQSFDIVAMTTIKLNKDEVIRLGGKFVSYGIEFIWDRYENPTRYQTTYKLELYELGYDTTSNDLLVRYYMPSKNYIHAKYTGWTEKDFLKNVPISVAKYYDNAIIEIPSHAAFLRYSDNPILREYYGFVHTYRNELVKKYGTDSIMNAREKYVTELLHTKMLIPVEMPNDKGKTIYWYYPDEDFLSALDKDKREAIEKEYKLVNSVGEITEENINEVCAGLNTGESYFDICRRHNGAITFISLAPNPSSSSSSKVTYHLNEDRNISISIHDINGKHLANLQTSRAMTKGAHIFEINPSELGSLQSGLYMVSVQSDQGENVVIRMMNK